VIPADKIVRVTIRSITKTRDCTSQSQNFYERRRVMAKSGQTKAAQPSSGVVAKVKDFGKNIGGKAKAAGTAARAHVSRNRAAYIAGGAGLAAGALTGAALARRKQAQNQD
jgi:hypothetical protein